MSFVPTTGPATFHAAAQPRESTVEFSDGCGGGRRIALPIRAALPWLTRAQTAHDAHPSVTLLGAAALLGLRIVAAGELRPAGSGDRRGEPDGWRAGPLRTGDEERVRLLAEARAYDDLAAADAEEVVRQVLDAVADLMPRTAPLAGARAGSGAGARTGARRTSRTGSGGADDFGRRLQERIARHRAQGTARDPSTGSGHRLPTLVTLSLRVEADEEELVAGAVRLVLQVHDEQDPLHVCEAGLLWSATGAEHGFGDRARTHAVIALRRAAGAWPVLDRLLELRVPDEITLDTDELVGLLDTGVAALAAVGVDVLWPRSLGRDLTATTVLERGPSGPRQAPLQTGVLTPDALFAFRWQLALHGDPLSEEEMDRLATAAGPIIKLRGEWTVVDPATARKAKKRLVRTVKPSQAVAAALSGVVEVDETDHPVVLGASVLRMRERIRDAATREPVEPPPLLRATLRDYQRHGLTWLVEMTDLGLGVCLADDMGLGKTVTLIALHLRRGGPTLVVCPASLMGNWEAELGRFAPEVAVRRFHGSRRDLHALATDQEAGAAAGTVVLTTYGTMRRATELTEVAWDLVVADEAQHVKNAQSATARALRRIPSEARVALTGTPVENDLTELWSILDWATPGLLGSRQAFRRAWAAPIEAGVDPEKTRRFADLIEPFVLRRRKSDPGVAPELPAKTETDHPLGLTREQAVLYEGYVRDLMARIERSDPEARRGLVLAMLTGLKQICNHPAQFLKQSGAVRLAGRSEKFDAIDELLATILAEDGAVLMFTQYVALGRLLESHLARQQIPHQFLHGGTPIPGREAMVRAFQAGPEGGGAPVFLLSLKAGGTGLNLTRADHVIHVDRWWNPAVEEQATDRAYRIGQTRPVQVHRLITQGTVEEKIAELLARKRALADAVLHGGEAALTELSDDELRDLVSLRPRDAG